MKLIEELHQQHGKIKMLLRDIDESEDSQKIDETFIELKKVLISHLINEDNYLYPLLRSLEETKQISESYEYEMSEISSNIMKFYSNYELGEKDQDFKSEIDDLIEILTYRISKEEKELYPVFIENFPNK